MSKTNYVPAIVAAVLDTFTDTNNVLLENHVTDSGHHWSLGFGGASPQVGGSWNISNNAAGPASGQNGAYVISSVAYSTPTEVSVQADIYQTTSNNFHSGLIQAVDSSFSTDGSYAIVNFQSSWDLFKISGGTFNSVGTVGVGAETLLGGTFADVNVLRFTRRTVSGTAHFTFLVNGRPILTYADSSPFAANLPGIYNDNGSGGADLPLDNFKVFPIASEVGTIVIGDSISARYVSNGGAATQVDPGADLWLGQALSKGKNGLPIFMGLNAGAPWAISGTTSADWANGGNVFNPSQPTNLAGAIASISQCTYKFASVMLGVNDCKVATRISIAQYKANIASICAQLNASGVIAVLHRPTYVGSGAFSGTWDNLASIVYLPGYWEAIQSLVNGTTILLGDGAGFDLTAISPSFDLVHPSTGVARTLFGELHATAMYNAIMQSFSGATVSGYQATMPATANIGTPIPITISPIGGIPLADSVDVFVTPIAGTTNALYHHLGGTNLTLSVDTVTAANIANKTGVNIGSFTLVGPAASGGYPPNSQNVQFAGNPGLNTATGVISLFSPLNSDSVAGSFVVLNGSTTTKIGTVTPGINGLPVTLNYTPTTPGQFLVSFGTAGYNGAFSANSFLVNGYSSLNVVDASSGGGGGPATSLAAAMALATVLGPELRRLTGED